MDQGKCFLLLKWGMSNTVDSYLLDNTGQGNWSNQSSRYPIVKKVNILNINHRRQVSVQDKRRGTGERESRRKGNGRCMGGWRREAEATFPRWRGRATGQWFLASRFYKCAVFFDQFFSWSFWSSSTLPRLVVFRCVVLRFVVCFILHCVVLLCCVVVMLCVVICLLLVTLVCWPKHFSVFLFLRRTTWRNN